MVLESVIFGLLAAFGIGSSDLVAAVVVKHLGVLRTALGVNIVSVGVSLHLPGDCGQLERPVPRAAIEIGPLAIVSPIVSAQAVVVILLAVVFVEETLTGRQAVGAAATIVGIALASVDLGRVRGGGNLIGKGVLIALAVTVGVGVWSYSIGVLSRDLGWFLPVYVNRLLTTAILAPASVPRRQWPWQRLTGRHFLGVVLIGLLESGGLFAFARGTEVGLISIVAAVSITYPVVPILGGLFLLRERLALNQRAGLALVLAGLLVLSLSA